MTILRVLTGLGKSIEDTKESLTAEIKEIKHGKAKIKKMLYVRCKPKCMP